MSQEARCRTALIIGAGPAGLTAAVELLRRTDIRPIVLEASSYVGGISKTLVHNGNRIDIGGHRFFSKSERVCDWWAELIPIQKMPDAFVTVTYQKQQKVLDGAGEGPDPAIVDRVMLVRQRRSRIYFLRRFFDYPIRLTPQTLMNLGLVRSIRIVLSYAYRVLFPIRYERNLEDFFINRFGKELYQTFFKSYTEKVWGVACEDISAEWGAQRVKGLSISKAVIHFLKSLLPRRKDIRQTSSETSLIERFLYPKFGPGQMWEEAARVLTESGGTILFGKQVESLKWSQGRVTAVHARNVATGELEMFEADYVISTMPVKDLIAGMGVAVPSDVQRVAAGLQYRDFISVGLLLSEMRLKDPVTSGTNGRCVSDNWIYIQEPDVKVGRLQIFNNWSPSLVADPEHTVWVGLEYFVTEGDELWTMPDEALARFAAHELEHIGLIDSKKVLDFVVVREKKTYPAYFGTYAQFELVRDFVDGFENLFLIGRNGMHKYNNQDHSMLTAMVAVDAIRDGVTSKEAIWEVNTEQEYHEEGK